MTASDPLRPDRAATALLGALTAEIAGRDRALVRKALGGARRARLAVGDPAVTWTVDGTELVLPLSHDLPVHRARHPRYSANLGSLAAAVAAHDPTATLIDIGANVGDSVAIIRARTPMPVLCIEGDEVFLPYLRRNVADADEVEVAPHYVSVSADGSSTAVVERSSGTARLVEGGASGTATAVRDLISLLGDHPRFARPRVIKVDTDGHDADILTAAAPLLGELRPVLFFEHDPGLAAAVGSGDPADLFAVLAVLGYEHFISFTNVGQLVGTDRADRLPGLVERSRRLGSSGQPPYLDVVALHADDAGLLGAVEAL